MTDNHSEQDQHLFLQQMQDVTPLKQDGVITKGQADNNLSKTLKRQAIVKEERNVQNPLSLSLLRYIKPYDEICYKKDGVQEKVFKNLRLGKYPVDSSLHLNQLDLETLRADVYQGINDAYSQGIRTLLIRHGTGINNKPQPALIKSALAQWLPEIEQVIAAHSALKSHGGSASTYVLLKKNEQQKTANRELHRKR